MLDFAYMNNSHLTKGQCVPCEGGTKPMDKKEIKTYLSLLKTPWKVSQANKIEKLFMFKDFKTSMMFVNKVADIAEDQGHHPDIKISYNKVGILLTTHAIGGLSVNDFIVASKVEVASKA